MKKFLSLENFIYLAILLLPSYLIKVSFFGVPTNVLEIMIVIALFWAILLKLNYKNFLKPGFEIAIGMMLVGFIIATVVNGNYAVGAGIIKGWFVLPIILATIVKTAVAKEKIANIYHALYFSGLAVAAVSLGYYFAGQLTFDGRLEGIFNSPNYLAMYLAPAIVIGIVSAWGKTLSKQEKIVWYASLILAGAAFYLTYSYAAWVSLGISLFVLTLIRYKGKICQKHWVSGIVLVVLVILSQWNSQKFQDLKNISDRSSFQSRLMVWSSAEKIVADYWIWGIGPGNFQTKYLEYQKYFSPYLEWAVPHPHSLYLAFWLYAGTIGLIGFVLLMCLWLRAMIKKEQTFIWFVSLGIMLLLLVHGLVDTTYFKNDLASIFWLNFFALL